MLHLEEKPHQPGFRAGPLSCPNWSLKMLVFREGGKPENPEKPSEQGENLQQTQPSYDTRPELNHCCSNSLCYLIRMF